MLCVSLVLAVLTASAVPPDWAHLSYPDYRTLALTNRQFVFQRAVEGERVIVAVNADGEEYTAHFDAGAGRATDLITGAPHDFGGGSRLAPYSVYFWRTE